MHFLKIFNAFYQGSRLAYHIRIQISKLEVHVKRADAWRTTQEYFFYPKNSIKLMQIWLIFYAKNNISKLALL